MTATLFCSLSFFSFLFFSEIEDGSLVVGKHCCLTVYIMLISIKAKGSEVVKSLSLVFCSTLLYLGFIVSCFDSLNQLFSDGAAAMWPAGGATATVWVPSATQLILRTRSDLFIYLLEKYREKKNIDSSIYFTLIHLKKNKQPNINFFLSEIGLIRLVVTWHSSYPSTNYWLLLQCDLI